MLRKFHLHMPPPDPGTLLSVRRIPGPAKEAFEPRTESPLEPLQLGDAARHRRHRAGVLGSALIEGLDDAVERWPQAGPNRPQGFFVLATEAHVGLDLVKQDKHQLVARSVAKTLLKNGQRASRTHVTRSLFPPQ